MTRLLRRPEASRRFHVRVLLALALLEILGLLAASPLILPSTH